MRIVIDLQGAQTASRLRGIGRYTLALTQAVARCRGSHEIIIALNGLFKETIQPIRAAFQNLLPQSNILVWEPPGQQYTNEPDSFWHETAELVREGFLASLYPDIIWISSLFEGHSDEAIISVKKSINIPVVITCYDLIPLINAATYFQSNHSYEQFYRKKITYLKQANGWLAISGACAQEMCTELNLNQENIATLPSGCDARFRSILILPEEKNQLYRLLGIKRKFVLYVGAADGRKNLPKLLQAYLLLSEEVRYSHQLLIVGQISADEIFLLKHQAKATGFRDGELIFAGYVTDDVLVKLYNLCEVLVFPSWHEGFGLPLVEAMACGSAVIGANTSSVPEVIGYPEALFDPFDAVSISRKLEQVLTDVDFRTQLIKHGLNQVKNFSWDESARLAIKLFEKIKTTNQTSEFIVKLKSQRLKLAFVGVLPPHKSNISEYNSLILSELIQYYDIEVIMPQEAICDQILPDYYHIRTPDWLRKNFYHIDRVIYQLDNSVIHDYILSLLEDIPGTVVLHDFFLSDLYLRQEQMADSNYKWLQELYYSHGFKAIKDYNTTENLDPIKLAYPLNLRVIQNSIGIIVHSDDSKQLAQQWYGEHFAQNWKIIPYDTSTGHAKIYAEAIEFFYQFSHANPAVLAKSISRLNLRSATDQQLMRIAESISENTALFRPAKQLLIDVTNSHAFKANIQQIVPELIMALLQVSIPGYRIEPVYRSKEHRYEHYRYARQYTLNLLNYPKNALKDDILQVYNTDCLFVLDLPGGSIKNNLAAELCLTWQNKGVKIYSVVNDLLPLLFPQTFSLKNLNQLRVQVHISQESANELSGWLERNNSNQASH